MMHPVLRKLEGFAPLAEEDRLLLQDLVASERDVPGKIDVICEGDTPKCVHVMTSGFACRYKRLETGGRQIVAFLIPGDFCDLNVSMLETMDHSIATLSPTKIAEVPRDAVVKMLERPALAKAMLIAALVDAATLREWLTNIGRRKAEHRIAHLFCELHARFLAVGRASGGTIALPINQTELSDALGLSIVHLNRSLQRLRSEGLIAFKNGTLNIFDLPRLESECGFAPNYLHLPSSY